MRKLNIMNKKKIMLNQILIMFVGGVLCVHCSDNGLIKIQLTESNKPLTHLVFDDILNVTYIGGVNKIYKLDSDLALLEEHMTGPINDSIRCHPPNTGIPCTRPKVLTDNYNQVLLIYRSASAEKLITCGSVYQGACETRDLPSLDNQRLYYKNTPMYMYAVADNGPELRTVAYIADRDSSNPGQVLYVATTFNQSHYRGDEVAIAIRVHVPAVSTRKLYPDSQMFDFQKISNIGDSGYSFIKLREEALLRGFTINYVTGFSLDGFSYFLTTQPKSALAPADSPIITRIVQICHNDAKYYSYVDIPIQCGNFSILKTAKIVEPGTNFLDLDIYTGKIMVGIFSQVNSSGVSNSAICLYGMEYVKQKLLDNIKECYKGNKTVNGGGYLRTDPTMCNKVDRMIRDERLLCNRFIPSHINIVGVSGAMAYPAIKFPNTSLTSLALTANRRYIKAFVGTEDGKLKKLAIVSGRKIIQYGDDIIIDLGSPINQDMVFVKSSKHLLAMSQRKVAKISLNQCHHYNTCSDCLSNFCEGWCVLENR